MSKKYIIHPTKSPQFWENYQGISWLFQNEELLLVFLDEVQIEQGIVTLDPIPKSLVQAHYLSHQCFHQGKVLFHLWFPSPLWMSQEFQHRHYNLQRHESSMFELDDFPNSNDDRHDQWATPLSLPHPVFAYIKIIYLTERLHFDFLLPSKICFTDVRSLQHSEMLIKFHK